jgi:predicted aspartyl protease
LGTFLHPITLIVNGRTETVDALVDTGATFTTLPAHLLDDLGVRAHRTVRLRLADGRVQERRIGRVLAELDGEREEILCAFGDPGDIAAIGAHTLEAFLLAVDPVDRRLVPVEGFWALTSHG